MADKAEKETLTPLERDRELLDTLLGRLEPLGEGLTTVLDSIMSLYQDHSRHQSMHKYGPQDAAAAYMAIRELMEAGRTLSWFCSHVDNAKSYLSGMSGDLYLEQEAKEADTEEPDEE